MKKLLLAVSVSLALTGAASAQERNNIGDLIYYEIGGDSRIPARDNDFVPFRGGVSWEVPSCGGFDPAISVTNILNGVTGAVENLQDTLINTATGVISNWPMMLLARTDPELYEMIKQGQIKAEELFQMSVSSCQAISNDVVSGENGVEDWVQFSGFEKWSSESENTSGKDVVQLDEDIQEDKGNEGVEMPSGRKGGENQDPIDALKEGILAGSNALSGREPDETSDFPQGADRPWFADYWDSPEEMEEWTKKIIGEVKIRTCEGCEKIDATPGKGVYPVLEDEQKAIAERIRGLVEGIGSENDIYDPENIADVSAPGFRLSPQVFEALKAEELYRDAFIEALADEVALARMTERMLAMRRVLLASQRNATLAKNPQALKRLDKSLEELAGEMELLKEEFEFRRNVQGSVAARLMQRARAERQAPVPQKGKDSMEELKRLEEIIE